MYCETTFNVDPERDFVRLYMNKPHQDDIGYLDRELKSDDISIEEVNWPEKLENRRFLRQPTNLDIIEE